jgi:hypothetical protein
MGVFIRCRRCGTFQVLHDSTGVHSHVILLLGDWRGGLELRPNHFCLFSELVVSIYARVVKYTSCQSDAIRTV